MDYDRELSVLRKENKRLQDDLNKTEDNYNEQCLLYKQKLNDERQCAIEIKEEMRELRNNYDKKINSLVQQILDKDDEINRLRSELRENTLYQRSSINKSPEDVNMADHILFHGHHRSLTPSGSPFIHSHSNSSHIHPNPITDSIGGSLRSSLIFNNLKPNQSEGNEALENASRIECKQCYSLLNPNDFYNHIRKDGSCAIV